jgi:acyl-CoA synthetase (AMP-forming)/AMP-acid ligase II
MAAADPATLVELLRRRAREQGHDRAYVALADRGGEEAAITFAELGSRACALAGRLSQAATPGDRALLLFPSGVEFVVALFACFAAGVIAVPLMPPRRNAARDASASILADCTPRLALSAAGLIPGLKERFAGGPTWMASDEGADAALPEVAAEDIALLQYTSGSTSAPKGVVVTHANLLANSAMIRAGFGNTARSTYVSWLPHYHDMGLIIHLLQSLYLGSLGVLMSPVAFLQRPLNWLRAISDYRAEVSGGPNFGYELCVSRYRPEATAGIDLSSWRVAVNGAEPVRDGTMRRFAETFASHGFAAGTMHPAYGMAEATVLIAAGKRDAPPVTRRLSRAALQESRVAAPASDEDAQIGVGCGNALVDERIAIVDPDGHRRLGADEIGEIWVAGPNVAEGYWANEMATREAFGAAIAGEDGAIWLRTGDLGFLDAGGELFVTGRIKDIIIIRGANHYPQDIEHTVETAHPALAAHGGAAFAVTDEHGEERLVVVQEVERSQRHHADPTQLQVRIREAVVSEHDIVPFAVILLRPGTLPKTTSGKIQRAQSRRLWLEGGLDIL